MSTIVHLRRFRSPIQSYPAWSAVRARQSPYKAGHFHCFCIMIKWGKRSGKPKMVKENMGKYTYLTFQTNRFNRNQGGDDTWIQRKYLAAILGKCLYCSRQQGFVWKRNRLCWPGKWNSQYVGNQICKCVRRKNLCCGRDITINRTGKAELWWYFRGTSWHGVPSYRQRCYRTAAFGSYVRRSRLLWWICHERLWGFVDRLSKL